MAFWVDSEPRGGGRWVSVLHGTCDHRAFHRLQDEGRALALAGAEEVDMSLAGVDYLDDRGLSAIRQLSISLEHMGIVVRIGGAVGQPADILAGDVPPVS